jgi:hypothetical protein
MILKLMIIKLVTNKYPLSLMQVNAEIKNFLITGGSAAKTNNLRSS